MLTELFRQRSLENSLKIESAIAKYPSLWSRIIKEWQALEDDDAAWLLYSANYLLRTAGVRWALDPFSLLTRAGYKEQPDFKKDLEGLQLVVLSHAHNDHFDRNLVSAIRNLPITWVIPSFMLDLVLKNADIEKQRILIPRNGDPIHFGRLTLTPFDALHMRGSRGVPEMGYMAEFSGIRWLFPGDTRLYDPDRIPSYENLKGVFAHLWLGKGKALEDKPLLLDAFCHFFARIKSKQIIISHLEELGRDADDYWDLHHYQQVSKRFYEIAPEIKVSSAVIGQRISL